MVRNQVKCWRNLLFLILIGGAFWANGESSYQNNEIFHAEYLNGAIHAAGSSAVTAIIQSAASYDVNPVTSPPVNEGLKVGNGNASLSYETSGNLPAGAGSVEVRFKPVNWDFNADNYATIFQTGNSGTANNLYIYKYKNQIAVSLKVNGVSFFKSKIINETDKLWANHTYHHVMVTYDTISANKLILYVDNVKIGEVTITSGTISSWPTTFNVGPSSESFGYYDGQTTIERVRIYGTVLDATAVGYLAAGAEFNYNIGTPSDWFKKGRPQPGGLAALDRGYLPMEWSGNAVAFANNQATCWNRLYSFTAGNLLTNITSETADLLSSPATLQTQSGTLSFGDPAVVSAETGNGRLVFNRTVYVGGSLVSGANLKCTLEYDGLLWCELTGLPSSGLTSLKLTVPYKKEAAELTHYVGAPTTYTSQNLPSNSYSKSLPLTAGVHHQSGLKTMVWVGNNKRGMLWCMESDQFWWPKNRADCIKLERLADGVLNMDITMVAAALPTSGVPVPQTLSYSFGLMATPVKPLPAGWRGWTHSDQYKTGDLRGTNVIYWPSEYRFMAYDQDPTRYVNLSVTQTKISNDQTANRYILPYWTRSTFMAQSTESETIKVHPESSLFTNEWGTDPNNGSSNKYVFRLASNTAWSDYLVWNLEEFVAKMGHADGFYLDEVQPIPNKRAATNGGYDCIGSGSTPAARCPTYEMFGTRNFIKRLAYNTYVRNTPERPKGIAHCSGTQTVNSLSGCDILLIGEQFSIGYFWEEASHHLKPPKAGNQQSETPNNAVERYYYYSYALSMDRVRAECYGRQWGEVMLWLPQFKGDQDDDRNTTDDADDAEVSDSAEATRDMLSRVMQADVVFWPLWCNDGEITKTWEFRETYGIGATDVEFHPYWEQSKILALNELIGWWRLNENVGTTATDASGFGHGAAFSISPAPAWADGIAGKALSFASGSYLDCGVIWPLSRTNNPQPPDTVNALKTYSVSCWVKPTSATGINRHIAKTEAGNTGFLMQLDNNNKLNCYQYVGGSALAVTSANALPADGEFHHVAMTFSSSITKDDVVANKLKIYVDGVMAYSEAAGETNFTATDARLTVGGGSYSGVIDDVKLFSKTLSDAEVLAEYGKKDQLVSLKFNDGADNTAADSASYGFNGALSGTTLPAWADDDGRSIHFSNNGGYVSCGPSDLFGAAEYTVECKVRPDAAGAASRHIIETTGSSTLPGFLIQLHSDNKLYCYQTVNGSFYNLYGSTAFPHDGAFHHVAMTFSSGTPNTLKIYLDGVLATTVTASETANLTLSTAPIKIGHGTYVGNVKDFAFHSRTLSDSEIAVNAAAVSGEPDVVAGYYSKTSGEYLALISNLSRSPRKVLVDFGTIGISSLKDAETNSTLLLDSNGKLLLEMNRNDYRALRINY